MVLCLNFEEEALRTMKAFWLNDKNYSRDKNGFHGANSEKVTSFEEEALRTMKAFWLPSATPEPEAPVKVESPSTSTICPDGKEKLKLKSLFPIYFTVDNTEQNKSNSLDKTYICPSCRVKGGTGFAGNGIILRPLILST